MLLLYHKTAAAKAGMKHSEMSERKTGNEDDSRSNQVPHRILLLLLVAFSDSITESLLSITPE